MLILGYESCQNSYESDLSKAGITQTLTLSALKKYRSHPCQHYMTLVSG
jgi:hypothetical protein